MQHQCNVTQLAELTLPRRGSPSADGCREGDGGSCVLQPTLRSRLYAGEQRLAVGHVAQLSGGRAGGMSGVALEADLGLIGRLSLHRSAPQ